MTGTYNESCYAKAVRETLFLLALASCQRSEPGREAAKHDQPAPPPTTADAALASPAATTASPEPPAPPQRPAPPIDTAIGHRTPAPFVGTAYRAAIGDLDGDGKNEIALADAQNLHVISRDGKELAGVPVPGGPQVLVIADGELFLGTGLTREHKDAQAKVTGYHYKGGKLVEEAVLVPTTSRPEITAIVPGADHALLVGYFDSKYMVKSVLVRRAGTEWKPEDIGLIRMATSYARADVDGDGKPDIVIGRVYGDDKGVDGDAFVFRPDTTRVKIPTTRGVREIAVADTDGDGKLEIYLADGWHQNYGTLAQGLLTQATFGAKGFDSTVIEDTAGQYSVGRILPADVDGDGKPELVTQGSSYVRVFKRTGNTWTGTSIAGMAKDIAVGDLDGKPGAEILVLTDKPEIISLK